MSKCKQFDLIGSLCLLSLWQFVGELHFLQLRLLQRGEGALWVGKAGLKSRDRRVVSRGEAW